LSRRVRNEGYERKSGLALGGERGVEFSKRGESQRRNGSYNKEVLSRTTVSKELPSAT
jgi:hypothetical protein